MSIQDDVINKTFEQIRRIQDSEISQGVSSDELHINLKTLGAKGDGIADDTTYVRSALDSGFKVFNSGTYLVTDAELVRKLMNTSGSAMLVHEDIKYPFGDVYDDVVLNIKPDNPIFYTIQYCYDWLAKRRIYGHVRIQFADGKYTQDFQNNAHHIDGKNITILGNVVDRDKVWFDFDNSDNRSFVSIAGKYQLGFIDGFTVKGVSPNGMTARGKWGKDCYAAMVRAIDGGVIYTGPHMRSIGMYYMYQAKEGGVIKGNYTPPAGSYGGGVRAELSGDAAFHAYNASIEVNGAEAIDTAHNDGEDLGFGFCAEANGSVLCEFALAMNNHRAGFYSIGGGSMWAHGTEAVGNQFGVLAWTGGYVECNSLPNRPSKFHNNLSHGVWATQKGVIGANSADSYENGGHGFFADSGAYIDANGTKSHMNKDSGYVATSNGTITGYELRAYDNTKFGFYNYEGGVMRVPNAHSDRNDINFRALDFAVITAKGATESDAKTKGFMPDTFDVLQKLSDDQCAIKIK